MLRLRNRLLPLLRAASPSALSSPIRPRPCHLLSTSTSTSTTSTFSPSPGTFSLEDYLVTACGLGTAEACKVSKQALDQLCRANRKPLEEIASCRLNSASNPDAILALLSGAGLSRADIAAVVSVDPLLLRASVKNIGPRLLALRDRVGLSAPQIARLLLVASRDLRNCDVIPRLEFFISLCGSFEKVLAMAKRNNRLLSANLENVIEPNIALLRQWGVQRIGQLCSHAAWVPTFNLERLKDILLRAEELGVPRTSGMFRRAVTVLACTSKEKVVAKIEFFKRTLGCSEYEVSIAISQIPEILRLSDEYLLRKIEFLVNEVAVEPQYIVERPVLLAYSLEKRLVPRHYFMKVLQENGLLNSNMSFITLAKLGEETFKFRFIDCHKDSVPGLADAYAAAHTGIAPYRV